jgi:hypothetical protein
LIFIISLVKPGISLLNRPWVNLTTIGQLVNRIISFGKNHFLVSEGYASSAPLTMIDRSADASCLVSGSPGKGQTGTIEKHRKLPDYIGILRWKKIL